MNIKKNEISIRRSQLSPAKQALLEKRLRGESKLDNQQKFILRRFQHNPVPLSFAQKRLWFLAQLEPDSPFYNVSGVVRLQGNLNFQALQDSLQEIIQRHEALRCNFQTIEDKPVAFIASTKTLLFPIFDISELPANLQVSEVEKLACQEAKQPFDLSHDLLLRVKLLLLNPGEHILLFTMHHIVSDGWSISVLIQELATLYQAFCHGKISSLPELPIQYADFAIWQQDYLQGDVLTSQTNYWKQQLGGSLPVLQFPTDYPRPAFQSYKGKKYRFTVSKSLTTALRILSQQAEATLFMTLLAAFKTLIYRYSQEDDIIVGTAIANRNLPQIEKLIGFFVNTLVLRTNVSGNPSFLDLLGRVREVTLDAYNHQDLPFDKLVEEIQPERNLSHNPLFQVWFALNNNPMPSLEIGELTLSISETDNATAQFDFSLDMVEQQEELIGTFEYNSDLFDADTITRIAGHFQTLLAGIVANPEQQIASLPLVTETEENDLLYKWNNNQVEYPQDQCIHHLFENCVNKTPNSVSVVFQQQQLTYQELNSKANQLAHYLHSLGVDKNVLVGICVDRSVEMIVALLGVLKAGGAYVPLDPAYPQERLSFMLHDSQVSVLLTQQRLVASLPVQNLPVVCLDRDWEIISKQSEANPVINSTPDNLAYVIYTSGSTGKSKGVASAHRSLVNAFHAWKKAYQLDSLTSHLQMASFAFDVFSGDVIRALCSGAKLVLCPREWLLEPEKLYQLMLAEKVDSAEFVPAVLRNLVQYLEKTRQNLYFMRLLVVGSDSLYVKEYKEFQRYCGEQTRLINSYGVTEATIDSTYFEVRECNLPENGLVPIGRPLANTKIYILDPYLQPVPVGIPGEIYIGGVGLAQGYLNRPDLTTERFILWNGEKRLYKTGDKAKYLADGNIEFLGRLDYQIKLRGFRIELGEIEAVINEHPSVREATVISRKDVSDSEQLVAYIVANTSNVVKEQTSAVDLNTQQTSQWQAVFDNLYNELDSEQQSGFYIKGWESSYTGLHIPDEEVRSWMDQTVERISALQPTRVLEIGSGSGLMLLRFAPHCTQYYATDISQNALNIIQQQLSKLGQDLSRVSFVQKGADDFTGMSTDTFDAVFIVSVAQYFPSVDYLLKVLAGAVNVVEPGGFIFLGDVRNFSLLEAFHTSVQLHKAPDSLSLTNLQQRVQKQIFAEKQLVIDPAFFIALKQHLPKISHVEIHLERGHFHNELTKFRYDVIIHVGHEIYPIVDISWLDWQQAKLTLPSVRQLLIETEPDILAIANVPNARVSLDVKAVEFLKKSEGLTNVGELRQALQTIATTGVDPEELWALAKELPYDIDISWSDDSVDGQYNVVFKRRTAGSKMISIAVAPSCTGKAISPQTWSNYANAPLHQMSNTQLVSLLRQCLKSKLPNYMVPSAFVMLNALPLTPNGKVDRKALPEPERIRPEIEETYVAPQTTIEKQLAVIWAQVLGLEKVGINNKFFELGGDSILSIQVVSKANQAGLHFTPKQLFQHQTIAQLATVVRTNISVSSEQSLVTGSFPLTPIQRWFFEENFANSHHYNQAVLLEVQQALNPELLEQVVHSLLQHHDLLRSRFIQESSSWQAIIAEFEQVAPIQVIDLSTLPPESQSTAITATCSELQASLNLFSGQLLQVALFNLGINQHSRLFIVIHHLVVDGVSWRILLEDLQTAYAQVSRGETIKLSPKTTSFKQWAYQLQQYAQSAAAQEEMDYWLQILRQSFSSLPVDYPRGDNTISSAGSVTVTLSSEETQALLQDVPTAYRTQINDVLLLALVQAFATWTGQTRLLLDLEGHGREEIFPDLDISRTIGWFTTVFPVVLSVEETSNPGEALKMVKEQLRRIPNRGFGYGVLYYLNEDREMTEVLRSLPKAEVSFNYLGQLDQVLNTSSMFKFASESEGSNQSDRNYRSYLLEIDSSIISGQLQLQWHYSQNLHQQSTVETLAQRFIEELRSIIAHCQSPEGVGFTPSDFPLVELSQAELDKALQQISF
jgi:amino acid adenylation domain-containing protein/non-ribosomal peptide synthase protein (TIGR01720 family)